MGKGIIIHNINDWSKIDESDSFWGRVNLLRPEKNFGIHRYNNNLWTSGLVGIGRLFDKNGNSLHENGREHVLVISSRYGMNPWKMLETVILDDEYDLYQEELVADGKFLFQVFYDQPLIKLPQGSNCDAEILFALSYINACYSLCKKGLKKSLIYKEENFTAKLRGKIDVNKNVRHNTTRGRCDKFYCKYVDFTEDTVENRIIKGALEKSQLILKKRFPDDARIRNKISFCKNSLKHVKKTIITNKDFNNATSGGLYSYYRPVIQQARSLMDKRFFEYSEESNKYENKDVYMIPYMINMETLFEYYSRTILKKSLKNSGYILEKYSKKFFLQKGVNKVENAERGIHLMSYCIPDIVVCDEKTKRPLIVLDAKYKPNNRPDRQDSHQLLSYVLLAGVNRCGFVMPGEKTILKRMKTTGFEYLSLMPDPLNYYELILGNINDELEIYKILL